MTNHVLLGLIVPLSFLGIFGVFAKRLIHVDPWFKRDDFSLGFELTIAAITTCMLNSADLYRLGEHCRHSIEENNKKTSLLGANLDANSMNSVHEKIRTTADEELGRSISILAMSIFAFMIIGTIYRQSDARKSEGPKGIFYPILFSNALGLIPILCYILWVKGIG